jgi:hypothetical protein
MITCAGPNSEYVVCSLTCGKGIETQAAQDVYSSTIFDKLDPMNIKWDMRFSGAVARDERPS